jgi:O-antigen ligase
MASIAARRIPISWRLRHWAQHATLPPSGRRALAIAGLVAVGAFWGALVGVAGVAAALICISLFACVFVMRDFRVGVGILIAIMPISQSYVFPHAMFGVTGLNPLNLLLVTTLLSLFMRSLGDGTWKHFLPRSVLFIYIAPLVMGVAIGMFHVDEIPKGFRDLELIFFDNPAGYVRDMLLKPLTFVVYALLVAAAVERSRQEERFITPMIVSVFVMAMMAVIFVAISGISLSALAGTFARHFFSAIGMHANDLGRLYATAYALLLFIWSRTDRMSLKTLLVISMGLVCVALVLTFSRGAFFGFILVNIIYLVSRPNLKTIVAAVLLVPVAAIIAPGAIWSRVTMGVGDGANAVTAGRTNEIWAPLLPELFKSPIWGDGVGSILWSDAMLEGRLPLVGHPHNAYLQAYTDMGVIGLVLLVLFWIYCWRHLRRLSKDARVKPELQGFFEGAAAGVLAFMAAGFAGASLAPVPAQAFMWLAVGVMFGVRFKFAHQQAK